MMEAIPLDDDAGEGLGARVDAGVAVHAPHLGGRAEDAGVGVEPAPAGNVALLDHDVVRVLEPDGVTPRTLDRDAADNDMRAVDLDTVRVLVRDVDCRGLAGGGRVKNVAG